MKSQELNQKSKLDDFYPPDQALAQAVLQLGGREILPF